MIVSETYRHLFQRNNILKWGISVAVTKPKMKETWHSIHRIPEYTSFNLSDDVITVGSSLSVAKMMQLVGEFCEDPLRNPILNLYSNYSSLQVSNLAVIFEHFDVPLEDIRCLDMGRGNMQQQKAERNSDSLFSFESGGKEFLSY